MPSPWSNLRGPARLLAKSATVLLVASGLLGIEAAIMIVLAEARDIVLKPFALLGYLEICAIFFSTLGILGAVVGLVFYHPYLYLGERCFGARRAAPEVSDRYTSFADIPSPLIPRNSDQDRSRD